VNTSWELIIESLRTELQDYGALLALFEDQQANLLRRDADAVLALVSAIEEQTQATHVSRERREQFVQLFARAHAASEQQSLRRLIPLFPAEVQPLITALIDEINISIHRIRRGARQNQILLSRAVETQEEVLRTLRPDMFPKMYSRRGSVGLSTSSAWQATG